MDIKVVKNTVIVFDLDDTLYNELDYLRSAYKSIALHLEPKDWAPLYLKMFSMYRSKINVFESISTDYQVEIGYLVDMYRSHLPEIELAYGALDVIKAIKKRNGKMGIVTDGRSLTQRAKIRNLGIESYMDAIVISEEFGSEKPNVKNFEAIENALEGDTYYYIADNLIKDFIAPNAMGWKTIGLLDNGRNIHFDIHKHLTDDKLPNHFIQSFEEINII